MWIRTFSACIVETFHNFNHPAQFILTEKLRGRG